MYDVRQIFVDIRPAPILIVQSKYSAGSQPIGPYIMLLWWHGVIPDVPKYSHNVLEKLNWSVREGNEANGYLRNASHDLEFICYFLPLHQFYTVFRNSQVIHIRQFILTLNAVKVLTHNKDILKFSNWKRSH